MTDLFRWVGLILTVLLLLCGCGASGTPPSADGERPPLSLVAPADLARRVAVADSARFRAGNDHLPGTSQRVSPGISDQLIFQPTWTTGSSGSADAAYAVYGFPLDDYAGIPSLTCEWAAAPLPALTWIGLGDFTRGSWDWQKLPPSGVLDYDPLVNTDGTGTLLAAIVILDGSGATLRYLRVGGELPPLAELTADVVTGNTPLTVTFDASGSTDLDGSITKYEFDPSGTGAWVDQGLTATYSFDYLQPGARLARVRVTDDALHQSITGLRVGNGWQHTWGGMDVEEGGGAVVDGAGNIYILSLTTTFGQGANEMLLLKYSPLGAVIWQKTLGTSNGDEPTDIILGGDGHLYCSGSTITSDNAPFICSLTTDGVLRWQKILQTGTETMSAGLAWTSDDNVVLVSNTYNMTSDLLLAKFSASSGSLQWLKTWDGADNDRATGVDYDPVGNIYMWCRTSSFSALHALENSALIVLDSAGIPQVEAVYGIDAETTPTGISVVGDHVLATCETSVVSLTKTGTLLWQTGLTITAGDSAQYWVIARPDGGCYLGGAFQNPGFLDGNLIEVDHDGQVVISRAFTYAAQHVSLNGGCLAPDGGLFLTGRASDIGATWTDLEVVTGAPALAMTAVSGSVADVVIPSVDHTMTLLDVPAGSETIDTGAGGEDTVVLRYYPF